MVAGLRCQVFEPLRDSLVKVQVGGLVGLGGPSWGPFEDVQVGGPVGVEGSAWVP